MSEKRLEDKIGQMISVHPTLSGLKNNGKDLTQQNLSDLVELMEDATVDVTASESDLELRQSGFGRFWFQLIPARQVRNPGTGELIDKPAEYKPKVKLWKKWTDKAKELTERL